MLAIAGQTAGPIGLNFFMGTLDYLGVYIGKIFSYIAFFFPAKIIYFFKNQLLKKKIATTGKAGHFS